MLIRAATKTLVYDWHKYAGAVFGISMAMFLVVMQTGFYQGFQRDITIVPDSFDADVWIAPKGLLAFDYPTLIDDFGLPIALQDPGVAAASMVVFGWVNWKQWETGFNDMVVLVGFEPESKIRFDPGTDIDVRQALQGPGHVLVDAKDRDKLGLPAFGTQRGELVGRAATVTGFMEGRRLFTTAPLVVADHADAREFAGIPEFQTHFIALKCHPQSDPVSVKNRLQTRLPEYKVLTAQELHDMTQHYWKSQTGIGPLMFLAAALAAIVGSLTVLATFYILILQKLSTLAALRAIGASIWELAIMISVQMTFTVVIGIAGGSILIAVAAVVIEKTTISLVLSPLIVAWVVAGIGLSSYAACIPVLVKIARTDPALVFRKIENEDTHKRRGDF